MEQHQLAQGDAFESLVFRDPLLREEQLGALVREAPDHRADHTIEW